MNTDKRRNTRSIFSPLFIYFGINLAVSLGVGQLCVPKIMADESFSASMTPEELVNLVVTYVMQNSMYIMMASAVIGIIVFGFLFRKDRKLDDVFYTKVNPVDYLWPALLGITACLVNNNLVYFSGIMQVAPEMEEIAASFYQGNLPLELFVLGLLTPLSEELVFRGLIYKRARLITSAKWAAIMASLIFAMIHGNMIQGVYAFLSGLLLCYVYERYQSFLAPVVFHMAANLISVLASETGFLNFMFTGRAVFLAVTFGMAVLLVLAVYLIEVRIHVREVVQDGAGETKEKVDL